MSTESIQVLVFQVANRFTLSMLEIRNHERHSRTPRYASTSRPKYAASLHQRKGRLVPLDTIPFVLHSSLANLIMHLWQ